jgi:hypothetical protein
MVEACRRRLLVGVVAVNLAAVKLSVELIELLDS